MDFTLEGFSDPILRDGSINLNETFGWNNSVVRFSVDVLPVVLKETLIKNVLFHHTAINNIVDVKGIDDCYTALN